MWGQTKIFFVIFGVLLKHSNAKMDTNNKYQNLQTNLLSLMRFPLEFNVHLFQTCLKNKSDCVREVDSLFDVIIKRVITQVVPMKISQISPSQTKQKSVKTKTPPRHGLMLKKEYWIFLLDDQDAASLSELLGFRLFRFLNMNYLLVVSPPKLNHIKLGYIIQDLIHITTEFTKVYCTFCKIAKKWIILNGSHPKFHKIPKNYQGHCFIYPLVKLKPVDWSDFKLLHEMAMQVKLHKKPDNFVFSSLMPGAHALIPKYLMQKYNGSFTTCQDVEDSRGKTPISWHYFRYITINFKIIVFDEKMRMNKRSYLVSTGLEVSVKFMTPQIIPPRQMWLSLLGPLGFEVFLSVILLIPMLSVITYFGTWIHSLYKKSTEKAPTFDDIVSSIFRPLLDQCLEELSFRQSYFRIILSAWLFYCLLVSEAYRGELVSHLTKPPKAYYIKTFYDLAFKGWKANTPLTTFNKLNQSVLEVSKTLMSANKTEWNLGKPYNIFHWLSYRLKQWRNQSDDFFTIQFFHGKVHMIDKEETLHLLANTFASVFDESRYKVSDEALINPEFWSVMPGPFERDMVKDLNWCRDFGIFLYLHKQYRAMADEMGRIKIKGIIHDFTEMNGGLTAWMIETQVKEGLGPKKLQLRHYESIFAILAIGYLGSMLILGIEFYKIHRSKTNRGDIISTVITIKVK